MFLLRFSIVSFCIALLVFASSTTDCAAQMEVEANVAAALNRAELELRKAKYEDARQRLRQLKLDSNDIESVIRSKFLMAQVILNADYSYDKAAKLVTECAEMASQNSKTQWHWESLRFLGQLSRLRGKNLLATQYFWEALNLSESKLHMFKINRSRLFLAGCYISSGATENATELINRIGAPTSPAIIHGVLDSKARIASHRGDYETAIPLFEKAICANGKYYGTYLGLGNAYLENNEVDEARYCFAFLLSERGIQSRLIVADAHLGMARIEIAEKRFGKAMSRLDSLLEKEWPLDFHKRVLSQQVQCALLSDDKQIANDKFKDIASLDRKLEAIRMSDEVEFLKRQNEYRLRLENTRKAEINLRQANNELELAQTTQRMGLSILLLLLTGGVAMGVLLTRKRMAEKDLAVQSMLLEQETRLNGELKQKIDRRVEQIERQQEEQLLLERQLNIVRRDESLGKMTGGVAHDFNNLIMVVENVNELIGSQLDGQLTPKMRELLDCSRKATKSAAAITNRLLVFAKKHELKPTEIELSRFFAEYMPLIRQSTGIRNRLSLVMDDEATIFVDENQFLSSLINLCANSSDALFDQEHNPEIKIVVRCVSRLAWNEESGKQFVRFASAESRDSDQFVVISVSDNGCGMTPQQLRQACDPFFSTKVEQQGHQFGGTGLGLSVVKGVLEQSQAGLEFYSDINKGTTVRMVFPLVGNAPANPSPTIVSTAADLEGVRVLLVDDNELLLGSLSLILESLGCKVVTDSSGTSARQRLQDGKEQFDLLLSDVRMPNSIDGITLARWTRSNCPGLPIILMTGFSEQQVSSEFPFLGKPFQRDSLLRMVLSVLPAGRRQLG